MGSAEHLPFRLRPPDLPRTLVHRPRLLDAIGGRFERRLTVARGGAGFGKTTLLTHALAENRLDPAGVDVWMQIVEDDRHPDHFIAGLGAAIAASAVVLRGAEPAFWTVDTIGEAIWARAPESVAIVLDDVHLLDGADSAGMLTTLCERLPVNAHLVLSTRTMPAVPLRLLQARGEAVLIEEADLGLTESECEALAGGQDSTIATPATSTWPALAVLMSTVGRGASIEFLWEQVLAGLAPHRRMNLALLARFEHIDAALGDIALGSRGATEASMTGLPLIEDGDGEHRFHDLWRDALKSVPLPDGSSRGLEHAADELVRRGEFVRAARLLADIGSSDRVVAIARQFGASPISSGLDAVIAEGLLAHLPVHHRDGALGGYLRTLGPGRFQSERMLEELSDVFEQATADGDGELAALALWRETQLHGDLDPARLAGAQTEELLGRVERSALDGWPYARYARALILSHRAEQRRDVPGAFAALRDLAGPDEAVVGTSRTSRCLALGHPERVEVSLETVLAEGVREPVSAQAVWLRGEIDPTLAWPIVKDLPAVYDRRGMDSVQVPLLGVLTSVALAAGDVDSARGLALDASQRAARLFPRPAAFAGVADALVALALDGDAEAARRLSRVVAKVPLEPWPAWAHLGGICAIRALLPGVSWLDDLEFGSSLAGAVAAGRALAELRAYADDGPAMSLGWSSPTLLRVHVPPSMLTELALAVADRCAPAATCLDQIPQWQRYADRLVQHPHPATRSAARMSTAASPRRPPYDIVIDTFGELVVRRSDGSPLDERAKGGRVHQLLGRLLVDAAPLRLSLASELWPELSDRQAATNLRVTLASLLDCIEPDRRPGASWFVRSSDGRLQLDREAVRSDVWAFEDHITSARRLERSSQLVAALEHHEAAVALYRGPLLQGVGDAVLERERLRCQSLAHNSACRIGELLLAKGEPEEALAAALTATRIDPLSERGRHVEIRSHLALGGTTGARRAADTLVEMLRAEGLPLTAATQQLLARLSSES